MHNWTYITDNFISWSLQGYFTTLGYLFWPIFFSAIVGYLYLKNQSLTIVAVVLLVIFAAFGNALAGVEGFVSFTHIATALIMAGLVLYFITKLRR